MRGRQTIFRPEITPEAISALDAGGSAACGLHRSRCRPILREIYIYILQHRHRRRMRGTETIRRHYSVLAVCPRSCGRDVSKGAEVRSHACDLTEYHPRPLMNQHAVWSEGAGYRARPPTPGSIRCSRSGGMEWLDGRAGKLAHIPMRAIAVEVLLLATRRLSVSRIAVKRA
jgi:hypothetical protein